jgi:hypothetical protein
MLKKTELFLQARPSVTKSQTSRIKISPTMNIREPNLRPEGYRRARPERAIVRLFGFVYSDETQFRDGGCLACGCLPDIGDI